MSTGIFIVSEALSFIPKFNVEQSRPPVVYDQFRTVKI